MASSILEQLLKNCSLLLLLISLASSPIVNDISEDVYRVEARDNVKEFLTKVSGLKHISENVDSGHGIKHFKFQPPSEILDSTFSETRGILEVPRGTNVFGADKNSHEVDQSQTSNKSDAFKVNAHAMINSNSTGEFRANNSEYLSQKPAMDKDFETEKHQIFARKGVLPYDSFGDPYEESKMRMKRYLSWRFDEKSTTPRYYRTLKRAPKEGSDQADTNGKKPEDDQPDQAKFLVKRKLSETMGEVVPEEPPPQPIAITNVDQSRGKRDDIVIVREPLISLVPIDDLPETPNTTPVYTTTKAPRVKSIAAMQLLLLQYHKHVDPTTVLPQIVALNQPGIASTSVVFQTPATTPAVVFQHFTTVPPVKHKNPSTGPAIVHQNPTTGPAIVHQNPTTAPSGVFQHPTTTSFNELAQGSRRKSDDDSDDQIPLWLIILIVLLIVLLLLICWLCFCCYCYRKSQKEKNIPTGKRRSVRTEQVSCNIAEESPDERSLTARQLEERSVNVDVKQQCSLAECDYPTQSARISRSIGRK